MQSHSLKGIDFLIVGQSPQAFENDIALLQKAGYKNFHFADTVVEARNILASTPVNFVISEFDLPHMNGIEFLKLIRRHPALLTTPFLMVSKDKQMEMIKYALDELADGYLLAPYSGEEFLCAIIRIQQKWSSLSRLQIQLRDARYQFLKRNYDKAISTINEIVKIDPNNVDALLVLSECLYRKRQIEAARKHIKCILNISPHHSKALHLLSKICRLDYDCGDGFIHLTNALRLNPLNEDLKIDLGKFYLDTGADEKAEEIFNEVLNASPTDLCLIKIGKSYLKKNRLQEASNFLDKTVKPLPETAYIFNMYADMLEEAGNHAASLEQLKKCVLIAPGEAEYCIKYAKILLDCGQSATAQEVLKEYLKIYPDHETIKAMLQSL
jgi:two-component system chemotaxis response regulator CheY